MNSFGFCVCCFAIELVFSIEFPKVTYIPLHWADFDVEQNRQSRLFSVSFSNYCEVTQTQFFQTTFVKQIWKMENTNPIHPISRVFFRKSNTVDSHSLFITVWILRIYLSIVRWRFNKTHSQNCMQLWWVFQINFQKNRPLWIHSFFVGTASFLGYAHPLLPKINWLKIENLIFNQS